MEALASESSQDAGAGPSSAASGGSSTSSSSGGGAKLPSVETPPVSPRAEARLTLEQYQAIYDRLIEVFQQRPRDDWKKLIVFSKQWPEHKQGVFDRCGGWLVSCRPSTARGPLPCCRPFQPVLQRH